MNFSPAYGLLMIAGIVVSALLWSRLRGSSSVPPLVFVGGFMGAVVGAKLGYFLAELPFRIHEPNLWQNILLGRTILGGLLGGYAGVEWAKKLSGYSATTGDRFAIAVPLGLAIGRIGCFLHGCCPGRKCGPAWFSVVDAAGVTRYPTQLTEAAFHLFAFGVMGTMYAFGHRNGQLFHLYLIAYGCFRIVHEYFRDTPRIGDSISTYQILAAVVVGFGAIRYYQRRMSAKNSPLQ
jgi:phosphatidylglycerol:prolipoprotein diacylglycerol transferase